MLPLVAIVGRPNVGKSTLFNAITRRRDALVADEPGVTRDRKYGLAKLDDLACIFVDTGGLSTLEDSISRLIVEQVSIALDEADVFLFMVDARSGLTAEDQRIADDLRRRNRPVALVVNKIDGLDPAAALADFYALGLGGLIPISATHRRGLAQLAEQLHDIIEQAAPAPASDKSSSADDPDSPEREQAMAAALAGVHGAPRRPGVETAVRVTVIGRPNVGKSTLINRLTHDNRVIAHDMPGTTRDTIVVPFEHQGVNYELLDTAGVRRRARVQAGVEKLSVIKTLDALAASDVAVMMLDGQEGFSDQDAHILGLALDAGRALVIAVNKWDGLSPHARQRVKDGLSRRLGFIDFAEICFISALHGSGLGDLLKAVSRAWRAARRDLPTSLLSRILADAVGHHPPPVVRGRRIKLRYAHQGGQSPPRIIIHGNQTESVPDQYKRYLARVYREALDMAGTPIFIELRSGQNPFKGRRNTLTPRQQRSRQRLLTHVKRK